MSSWKPATDPKTRLAAVNLAWSWACPLAGASALSCPKEDGNAALDYKSSEHFLAMAISICKCLPVQLYIDLKKQHF